MPLHDTEVQKTHDIGMMSFSSNQHIHVKIGNFSHILRDLRIGWDPVLKDLRFGIQYCEASGLGSSIARPQAWDPVLT